VDIRGASVDTIDNFGDVCELLARIDSEAARNADFASRRETWRFSLSRLAEWVVIADTISTLGARRIQASVLTGPSYAAGSAGSGLRKAVFDENFVRLGAQEIR